jgi:hypothetical protein
MNISFRTDPVHCWFLCGTFVRFLWFNWCTLYASLYHRLWFRLYYSVLDFMSIVSLVHSTNPLVLLLHGGHNMIHWFLRWKWLLSLFVLWHCESGYLSLMGIGLAHYLFQLPVWHRMRFDCSLAWRCSSAHRRYCGIRFTVLTYLGFYIWSVSIPQTILSITHA